MCNKSLLAPPQNFSVFKIKMWPLFTFWSTFYQGQTKMIILLTQKRSENVTWECSWNVFMKVFLTFSERLCGSFSQNHQGIFVDHLISDYPIFSHHLKFMQTIFNFIYFQLHHVCVEQYCTCKLQIHYEKPS